MITFYEMNTHMTKQLLLNPPSSFHQNTFLFLNTSLWEPLNIPSEIPQRQNFQTEQRIAIFTSLKWIHTSESSFLECFFLDFISGYFTFRHSLQCPAEYHFFSFTGTVFKHGFLRNWFVMRAFHLGNYTSFLIRQCLNTFPVKRKSDILERIDDYDEKWYILKLSPERSIPRNCSLTCAFISQS